MRADGLIIVGPEYNHADALPEVLRQHRDAPSAGAGAMNAPAGAAFGLTFVGGAPRYAAVDPVGTSR